MGRTRTYAKIVPYSRQDVAEVHGCLKGGCGAVGVKANAMSGANIGRCAGEEVVNSLVTWNSASV